MAEEQEKVEAGGRPEKKGGVNPKVFIIGIPLFIIQLVLVYFVTGYIYNQKHGNVYVKEVKTSTSHSEEAVPEEESHGEEAEGEDGHGGGATSSIYKVEDIILNPAGTNGQVVMLVSVGFQVEKPTMITKLEENEILVRDMIISDLSRKRLDFLANIEMRDSLKNELSNNMTELFKDVKIKNVYFSKYIIQ